MPLAEELFNTELGQRGVAQTAQDAKLVGGRQKRRRRRQDELPGSWRARLEVLRSGCHATRMFLPA
jgi:hypothetical protein